MPYNTTPLPPRKEVTGQVQLPLSRVKKIVAVDQDINICSNNAAFAITVATELFIQYLAEQAQNMAKLERKPRRNIQYKDLANAVQHQDNLEFLEDTIPKMAPYKQIKDQAAATRAHLRGEKAGEGTQAQHSNGKKQKSTVNGARRSMSSANGTGPSRGPGAEEDPNAQLEMEMEMRQAAGAGGDDGDVDMTGTG
ncbi:hypothetical protein NKR23_g4496 [Pleurostoma richardsiae]|uniref:Transcription factor CBF/NF-Y/archaeal histone domain-containing protein n=1 Tax=Pleurostoma richardsiae TaxID=41990 RepID=A0AA38RIM9_9PEZI|nr:hypothetical protein NKR23_g4496 [Pleurostoma richardsiae]